MDAKDTSAEARDNRRVRGAAARWGHRQGGELRDLGVRRAGHRARAGLGGLRRVYAGLLGERPRSQARTWAAICRRTALTALARIRTIAIGPAWPVPPPCRYPAGGRAGQPCPHDIPRSGSRTPGPAASPASPATGKGVTRCNHRTLTAHRAELRRGHRPRNGNRNTRHRPRASGLAYLVVLVEAIAEDRAAWRCGRAALLAAEATVIWSCPGT
jgi:hypothetical protein